MGCQCLPTTSNHEWRQTASRCTVKQQFCWFYILQITSRISRIVDYYSLPKLPITMTVYEEYSADDEIITFFNKTTANRVECDNMARHLTGSDKVVPITVQGVCSYTVYVGEHLEYVVQCRLQSLALDTKMSDLVTKVHGSMVPSVAFHGVLGEQVDKNSNTTREPLCVYPMSRMPGITQLDFVLARDFAQNSPIYLPLRQNLISDIARLVLSFVCSISRPAVNCITAFSPNRGSHHKLLRKSIVTN